jgi:hypothetical protein
MLSRPSSRPCRQAVRSAGGRVRCRTPPRHPGPSRGSDRSGPSTFVRGGRASGQPRPPRARGAGGEVGFPRARRRSGHGFIQPSPRRSRPTVRDAGRVAVWAHPLWDVKDTRYSFRRPRSFASVVVKCGSRGCEGPACHRRRRRSRRPAQARAGSTAVWAPSSTPSIVPCSLRGQEPHACLRGSEDNLSGREHAIGVQRMALEIEIGLRDRAATG